ncbi:unnamed protein product [Allacma fusca]|uniref:Uncharacterized protein n=1 Tax=Allacma fusca TaxID=39272 RepID=A0A8J2LBY6_9HEXA|nr:unnamed protein product [Allacma fusca]
MEVVRILAWLIDLKRRIVEWFTGAALPLDPVPENVLTFVSWEDVVDFFDFRVMDGFEEIDIMQEFFTDDEDEDEDEFFDPIGNLEDWQ